MRQPSGLRRYFILDDENVTFDNGVPSFVRLQQRMQIQQPSADLRRYAPVWFYAFDLPFFGKFDLGRVPLRYRKRVLEKSLAGGAKNSDSAYVSGRSREWLKFKCISEQEFAIVGCADPYGDRIGFGALPAGYERGELGDAEKMGTGYNAETLRRLGKQLGGHRNL